LTRRRSRLPRSSPVVAAFREAGGDAWFEPERPAASFLPDGFRCACGGTEFVKERDVLDVWFDSGVSHQAVLKSGVWPELRWPADVYVEGHDQHRGWFQSSLLTSVALEDGKPPFRTVITHGFVVDGAGRKMSKSLGNVIAPQDIVARDGADVLRLWVLGQDYREDQPLSPEIIARTSDAYRKIRNTGRYLLSNLFDFDPSRDGVPAADMRPAGPVGARPCSSARPHALRGLRGSSSPWRRARFTTTASWRCLPSTSTC
jgi:isoleucyl-tRNA synthetase